MDSFTADCCGVTVENIDDVGVADAVDQPRLAEEAPDDVVAVMQVLVKNLYGDLLADAGMPRKVHAAHSALAELGDNFVVPDG